MGRTLILRMLALAAVVIFMFAAYMEHQTGKSDYFIVAGLAVFSSIGIGLLMTRRSE